MRPELSIQSAAATEAALKPRDVHECERAAAVSDLNASDKIVTISGNTVNVESDTITRNATAKIVHFLKSQQPAPTPQNTSPPTVAISEGRTSTGFDFCNVSQCVSFQENIADVHHRKGRRLNGLQLPLHPLQLFGWLVLVLFGVASYTILIPSFAIEVQGPLYGLISGLYIVHVVSHVAALLIDPADRELRRVHRNDRIVPEFDRSKHTHVIENGRCHLCNIRTSSTRTKHCSVCNKCVGKFDHHCKWLNHCVGSRNYVAFLMCVVSAVIATLVIVAAVIAQIVLYYVQPEWLSYWKAATATLGNSQPGDSAIEAAIAYVVGGGNSSKNNSIALNDTLNITTTAPDLEVSTTNTANITAFPLEEYLVSGNTTLPTLLENVTALIADTVNGTSSFNNLTAFDNNGTVVGVIEAANSTNTVTIAGISISDTIFLVLIAFLGLLAAITAGLLLHLCFFHIYISFLGLTTYEYIRNHRQAQEAKAKNMLSTMPNNGQQPYATTNPSKKTNNCGQIYFCSSLRHPNAMDPTDVRYFETHKSPISSSSGKHNQLHCCANSREYHQTGLKTYYMCSLLEETPNSPAIGIAHISNPEEHDNSLSESTANFKTFHCCSTFAATATQRKVSAASSKATLVSDLEAALSARRSYLQYTEQCTFCTFRIRSPIVNKRASAVSSSTRSTSRPSSGSLSGLSGSKPTSASAKITTTEHQRCCMKAISKHQRWRRKWNCCSSVPDSPDVPNDIIAALAMRHQHGATATATATAAAVNQKTNATEIPVHYVKSMNGGGGGSSSSSYSYSGGLLSRPTSPRNATLKAPTRARQTRTWPVARLRHMMRMLNRYRRPRCRRNVTANGSAADQIKQNQIRPIQLQSNGCQYQHYCDSSSPQPPSTTTTASERSSDPSLYSDSSALTTPSSATQPGTFETILPTSVIRANTSVTYTTPVGITLPPALPPPTRRKIPNPTDLEELAETLGFASNPSNTSATPRLPTLNTAYRRQRRKHFLRTRSPTLSPIHESGLSNPTSPQPCRHNAPNCSPNAIVNNLCDSTEMMVGKNSSNSSLHSGSSNSSSN